MLEPLPKEKWTILDKEKEYMISNFGRCYSIKTNKVLKPILNNCGYIRYDIKRTKDKQIFYRKQVLAHIAVVKAFGDCNGNTMIPKDADIDHLDRNKFNNTPGNLEIISHSENVRRCSSVPKPNYDDEIFGIFN